MRALERKRFDRCFSSSLACHLRLTRSNGREALGKRSNRRSHSRDAWYRSGNHGKASALSERDWIWEMRERGSRSTCSCSIACIFMGGCWITVVIILRCGRSGCPCLMKHECPNHKCWQTDHGVNKNTDEMKCNRKSQKHQKNDDAGEMRPRAKLKLFHRFARFSPIGTHR